MTRHGWASFLERERQIYLSRSRSITLPPISLLFLVLAFSHPLLSLALVLTCSHPFLSLALVLTFSHPFLSLSLSLSLSSLWREYGNLYSSRLVLNMAPYQSISLALSQRQPASCYSSLLASDFTHNLNEHIHNNMWSPFKIWEKTVTDYYHYYYYLYW